MNRLLLAFLVSIGVFASCAREGVDLQRLIAEIDADLTAGALKQADENIRTAASAASSRREWLSVLKRAHTLGAAAGTYETLYATSKSAIARISGAEEIAALCVFAALRTGKVEIAYRYAGEYLTEERWRSLVSEAVLRKRALERGVLTATSSHNPLLEAVFSEDPDRLATAADLFGESRFSLTAALKYALRGEIAAAAYAIEPHAREYPKAALLLLYDAERFEDAREIFEYGKDRELWLLGGDIYLKLKEHDQALELYRAFIKESPGTSWIPYANAAIILGEQGRSADAMELLAAAKESIGEVRQLLLSEIIVVSESDKAAGLERLLSRYTERYPQDSDVVLISATINPTHANRIRLESALWSAFLKEPEYSRTARHLAASLIASYDQEGLSRLVRAWETANGETAWSLFLKGYHALMNHSIEKAVEAFERSYELSPQWEIAYNLSILSARKGDYDAAIEHIRMAENTLMRNEPDAVETKAFLRAASARILYERGDFHIAAKEAMYAMDLDPGCNEAAILLELLKQKSGQQ